MLSIEHIMNELLEKVDRMDLNLVELALKRKTLEETLRN